MVFPHDWLRTKAVRCVIVPLKLFAIVYDHVSHRDRHRLNVLVHRRRSSSSTHPTRSGQDRKDNSVAFHIERKGGAAARRDRREKGGEG